MFFPSGLTLSRNRPATIAVAERGRGISFQEVVLPNSWAVSMLRSIEGMAAEAGHDSSEYMVNCPFTIHQGQFIVTTEILSQYASKIEVLPILQVVEQTITTSAFVNGKVLQIERIVKTVKTFGTSTMHFDVSTGEIFIDFEISVEAEREYEGVLATELLERIEKTVEKEHFKIDGRIVIPKSRKGSTMVSKAIRELKLVFYNEVDKGTLLNW